VLFHKEHEKGPTVNKLYFQIGSWTKHLMFEPAVKCFCAKTKSVQSGSHQTAYAHSQIPRPTTAMHRCLLQRELAGIHAHDGFPFLRSMIAERSQLRARSLGDTRNVSRSRSQEDEAVLASKTSRLVDGRHHGAPSTCWCPRCHPIRPCALGMPAGGLKGRAHGFHFQRAPTGNTPRERASDLMDASLPCRCRTADCGASQRRRLWA